MGGKNSKAESKPKSSGKNGMKIDELMKVWKTGDLLALRQEGGTGFYFAVLAVPPEDCGEPVPPLAIYGTDHPIKKETLKIRAVNVKSAFTLMFFHGFTDVRFVRLGLDVNFERFANIVICKQELFKFILLQLGC